MRIVCDAKDTRSRARDRRRSQATRMVQKHAQGKPKKEEDIQHNQNPVKFLLFIAVERGHAPRQAKSDEVRLNSDS